MSAPVRRSSRPRGRSFDVLFRRHAGRASLPLGGGHPWPPNGPRKSTSNLRPRYGDSAVQIDDAKPARLQGKRVGLDTMDRVFGVINRFRDQPGVRFKGVRIEIGEDENTVTVRFQEREITAAMIEGVVNGLRAVLEEPDSLVNIAIAEGISFDTGFALKEFARLAGIELKAGDVSQEE